MVSVVADTRRKLLSSCNENRGRVLLDVKGRHRVKYVFTSTRAHTPEHEKKKKKFALVY
jgi:hypothetical protein